jgi:hypothetical protein
VSLRCVVDNLRVRMVLLRDARFQPSRCSPSSVWRDANIRTIDDGVLLPVFFWIALCYAANNYGAMSIFPRDIHR